MTANVGVTQDLITRSSTAYYEGAKWGLRNLMVGRLMLTARYLAFHVYETQARGILEKASLVPTGKVLSFPLEKIVDVSMETRVRARRSRPNWRDASDFQRKSKGERPFNERARSLDTAEKFTQLIVSLETETGLEIAMFEVDDASDWRREITDSAGAERS